MYTIYMYIYIYTYNILATNQEDWKSIKWLETDKIQELSAGNRGPSSLMKLSSWVYI